MSIFKDDTDKKKSNNKKKYENEINSYTQMKSFLNFYNNTKKQSRSVSHLNNRQKSKKFSSNLINQNENSQSPALKTKIRANWGAAKITNLTKKLFSNQENNNDFSAKKPFVSNPGNQDKKDGKNPLRNMKSINLNNPDKLINDMTGNNYISINQNQNSLNYKNPNEEMQNAQNNNAMNSQTKVLPINYRKNSVSILAGYEIEDIDSLISFIEKEKNTNKKIVEDDKEKENFNNIISNKYAYEIELDKYNNYIQKRPNSIYYNINFI